MGEASRKSSSCEARNTSTSGVTDNSRIVRFGKAKWFKCMAPSEGNESSFRLMALRKRGRGGGAIGSNSFTALILRAGVVEN